MKKLLILFLSILAFSGVNAQQLTPDNIDMEQLRKLQMAQAYIAALYVDSVDQEKVTEDAIKGMLDKLDPHSSYTNAEETRKLNEPLEGNFEGIGVQFNVLEDTLMVVQTVRKGPSEKVGIVAGDRIVSVDTTTIAGVKMDREKMMKLLRGPKGTKVRLGIVRRGADDTIYFVVERDKIPVNTIDAAYMLAPGTGYIRLDRFGATSGKEVISAIDSLQRKGMKNLVFDLTMNGGGYLEAAFEIANQFLNKDDLVVYTEGRAVPQMRYTAEGGGKFSKGKLIVLVDEYSASASEIVSGAVQDHDRGLIIGRRTFGKGLVQRPVPLSDGSMMRLTVAHYYTPSGRCIQKPYKKGNKEAYNEDLMERFKHGELVSIDSIHLDFTKIYKTLRKGRIVYGGGGVMPDIFVPMDTTQLTKFYVKLRNNNLINNHALKFIDKNRVTIRAAYSTSQQFIDEYEVPTALTDSLLAEAKCKQLTPKDDAELQATLEDLRWTLKSLILYDLWDRNEYFQFINQRNDIVKRALKELTLNSNP